MGVLPLASVTDPFWAIREAFLMEQESVDLREWSDPEDGRQIKMMHMPPDHYMLPENVYSKFLKTKIGKNDLLGMNCYVPDWLIPEHPAHKQRGNELDALFEAL